MQSMTTIRITKKNLFASLGKIISLLDENKEITVRIENKSFWSDEERPRRSTRSRSTSPRWGSGGKDDEEKNNYFSERSWKWRYQDSKARFHATGKVSGSNKKWNAGRWYKRAK